MFKLASELAVGDLIVDLHKDGFGRIKVITRGPCCFDDGQDGYISCARAVYAEVVDQTVGYMSLFAYHPNEELEVQD